MNVHQRPPNVPTRHRLTIADVLKMQDAGILGPDHRCELIDAQLVDMPSESDLHSFIKARLIQHFNRALDPTVYAVGPDTTLVLASDAAPEPDLFVHAAALRPSQVRGDTALLVVEIADSSLAYDLGEKAALYRLHGVREYWVVDIIARATHVHLLQAAGAPADKVPFANMLTPTFVRGGGVRFADLVGDLGDAS